MSKLPGGTSHRAIMVSLGAILQPWGPCFSIWVDFFGFRICRTSYFVCTYLVVVLKSCACATNETKAAMYFAIMADTPNVASNTGR